MRTGEVKLIRIVSSTSSSVRRGTGTRFGMAALFTRQSRPSNASQASSATRTAASRSPRSAAKIRDAGASGVHRASTCSRRSRRRATSPTVAPRSASIGASSAPMPDDAPVTRIVEPSICMRRDGSRTVATASGVGDRRDERAVQPNTPFAIGRRRVGEPTLVHLGAGAVHPGSSGAASTAHSRDVAREAEITRFGERPRPRREAGRRRRRATPPRPRRAASDAGLQVRRVAVVPAAVEAPHVADHELGLVVDGPEVRALEELGAGARTVWRMSSRRGARRSSARASASCEVLEQLGRVGQRLRGRGRRRRSAGRGPGSSTSAPSAAIVRGAPPPSRSGSAAPSAGCPRSGDAQMNRSPLQQHAA